ncbi:hypothetical protein FRC07_007289 [Ceratobasidium sp. 392]|nr:hypothetical protein FRC07_007289 [Ceratobasidium sp. 392]
MTSNDSFWGPELDAYSRNFEPCILEILWLGEPDPTAIIQLNILTLDGMETALGLSDPRHNKFPLEAELLFWQVMRMMQPYTVRMSTQGIFKQYWGFLWVRYLLHATYLTLLEEVGVLDDLLRTLPPTLPWTELSQAIALAATQVATQAVATTEDTQILNTIFCHNNYHTFEGELKSDAGFFVHQLWEDPASFFTLCSCNLLPGCLLIFLAAWKSLHAGTKNQRMINQDIEWNGFEEHFVRSEDSQKVTQAYGELLFASQHNISNIKVLSVDIMNFVGKFVIEISGVDTSTTLQERLTVTYQNLEFLWLFLKYRGQIPLVDGDKFHKHALTIFMMIAQMQVYFIKTRDNQFDIAQMLADADIVSLMTHILPMILDKGG